MVNQSLHQLEARRHSEEQRKGKMDNNKTRIRVGLIQLNCVLGDVSANLDRAEALLNQIRGQADFVCLPELFNLGYNRKTLKERFFELAETIPEGRTTRRLSELARRSGTALIAGLVEKIPNRTDLLYDTAVLFDRQGELVGRYRKSHLYPAENQFFQAGNSLPVFVVDGLHVGIAICFEAAFPPIFSTLAIQGAQVVFNPSAVPRGFGYLQDLRTRARAQDNHSFVVAVNHVGEEGDVVYCGRSQIADPRGDVVALASGNEPEALVAELDLSLIRDQRLQEPIFRGFRPEMYQFSHLGHIPD